MKRIASASLGVLLFFLAACSGTPNTVDAVNASLNMAGTWTLTTVSTLGHSSFSGTATITQTGEPFGTNGTTTLTAPVGQIALSQTGTVFTGTITNSVHQAVSFNFVGTLSNGSLTASGSTTCSGSKTATQTVNITGTITSSSAQGTYTVARGSGCYSPGDTGTFAATKR